MMRIFAPIFAPLAVLALCAGCAMPPAGPPSPAIPVFFQPWSAALDQNAVSAVASAAQQARAAPTARIRVIGAADSTGSAKANRYLSETRAQMVADQLVADGVEAGRIKVRGVGMQQTAGVPAGAPAQFSRRALIEIGE